MKFVYQTNKFDCFRACIASVLELPLDKVPSVDPHSDHDIWLGMWNVWLKARGLRAVMSTQERHIKGAGPRIGVVRSQRGWAGGHAVVVNKGTMIHDPHPEVDPWRDRRKIQCVYLLKKTK